ncbi:hypothetical protein KY308_01085 [Candidatus Woesearchaeota archaeon]|nr:hypothetical protein [Candidatus Woesearchaeota archaeon]
MVELKFNVEKQNIQAFEDVYSKEECEGLAVGKKEKGFSMLSKVKKLVSSKDSIHLANYEKRYEPFWHIIGKSNLEYKRKTEYSFQVKPEVRSVKIEKIDCEIKQGYCSIMGEDHCFEHEEKEILVDAHTGRDSPEFKKYIEFKSRKIKETEELMKGKNVVFPAKVKASFLVRQLIKDLFKPFEADKIIKEDVIITKLALYFRPIYAFEFIDAKKGKKYILDVDALTGEVKKGGLIVGKGLAEIFAEGDLFEIGTELVTDFIPGTKAGVMIAQRIKAARRRKKEERERNKAAVKGK